MAEDNNGLDRKGNEIVHGKGHHAERIKIVVRSMKAKGYTGIRVNQVQVDAAGNRIGNNRPDISAIHPKTGKRINIEYDNQRRSSLKHEHEINKNDSRSVNTHAILKPEGKVLKGTRTHKPTFEQPKDPTLANTLKLSGEKRVSQTKTKPEAIKSRYGSSSESSPAKGSANQESKVRGTSEINNL